MTDQATYMTKEEVEELKKWLMNQTKKDMTEQQRKAIDNLAKAFAEASKQITDEANRLKESMGLNPKSVGIKHDSDKTRFDLLIPEFIKGFADVMTFGAQKYSAWNYLGLDRQRVISAHHRHMNAYQRGELNDPETGLSHLHHATCCLQMLWALDNNFHGKEEKKCQT